MFLGHATILPCNDLNAKHHTLSHVLNTLFSAGGTIFGGGGNFGR